MRRPTQATGEGPKYFNLKRGYRLRVYLGERVSNFVPRFQAYLSEHSPEDVLLARNTPLRINVSVGTQGESEGETQGRQGRLISL